MTGTTQNFGVPLGGGTGRGGMLHPKQQHKFRVRVFSFGPIGGGLELTGQVVSVGRPTSNHNTVTAHSYNSTDYFIGKTEWQTLELTVRDDVTNSVSSLISYQEQKQMNHFEQTTALAGANYKFQMRIEMMDGGNTTVLESWYLEGVYLESVNWGGLDYGNGDAVQIAMTLRFANATQENGLMPTGVTFASGVTIS